MTKKERAKQIAKLLDFYFPDPAIPLEHSDPYTLLIAVLLSAQCTDKRVNLVTPHLFAKAKTPEEMVKLTIEEIQQIIRTCGLSNAKSKAIWNLSQQLIAKHHGIVPSNFADLEALPGVGHKTASVVMTQAFQKPAFPVDTHIHRCAKRWGLSDGSSVKRTEADLKKLFPKSTWNKLHLQIIYFARTYCPAMGHKADKCPICSAI
ncbi:MAG: endonuclease III [Parachlamydiales bacterium]|nr:endonuclease III [Candidatus Acheromyda pituitae]